MPLGLVPEEYQALLDINFVERYENMTKSKQYSVEETEPFGKSIRVAEVKQLIESMGYRIRHNKRERFYTILIEEDKELGMTSNLKIVVPFAYASVELIWSVWKDKKPYAGGVLSGFSRRLIEPNYRIPYLDVRSYEELREVLEENIALFKEFIEALKKYQ